MWKLEGQASNSPVTYIQMYSSVKVFASVQKYAHSHVILKLDFFTDFLYWNPKNVEDVYWTHDHFF